MPDRDTPVHDTQVRDARVDDRPHVSPSKPGLRRSRWALNTISVGVILAICSYGEKVLTVILISILLSFILAPVVEGFMRLHLPRGIAAAIAVFLVLAVIGGVVWLWVPAGLPRLASVGTENEAWWGHFSLRIYGSVIGAGICWWMGKFAFKRLILHATPPEKQKR